ncbi:UNVERIFIED_ORG: hypothetical protein M2435_006080 [Rhizobium sophorae]|uniref:Transposase zinc-binding domain family protein n=1 Tax=Rhizobium leguminosarum TaxID=384 RepID=A0A2Z4YUC0_RHILE|nr:Transposase zinc-binding domain family protein [Rhizobium leguminosarum]MBB4526071.1 hypothetical protein [Rhizobium leguminosarum]MDH6663143.1 hypothetical protein [Rhizobium sophorae]
MRLRVGACEDCGEWRISYNSCRNRHCPKCQGAAARTWLAEREADLLPVGYFHVVFTLPAEVAAIAPGWRLAAQLDRGPGRGDPTGDFLVVAAGDDHPSTG